MIESIPRLSKYLTDCSRFGWVNASFVVGLQITDEHMRRALGTLTPWNEFARATQHGQTILENDDD